MTSFSALIILVKPQLWRMVMYGVTCTFLIIKTWGSACPWRTGHMEVGDSGDWLPFTEHPPVADRQLVMMDPVADEDKKRLMALFRGERSGFLKARGCLLPAAFAQFDLSSLSLRPSDVWIVTFPRSGKLPRLLLEE